MIKMKTVANIAAAFLMVGGLGYYNFIDKPPVSSVAVGVECPNFIAKPFKQSNGVFSVSDDVFTLVKQRGKVCVVNFWETWCAACIKELPEFDEIQVHYGETVQVVALVGNTSTPAYATSWLNRQGWKEQDEDGDWTSFSLTLAYLPAADSVKMGCKGMLPRTVIVDEEGVVAFEQDGSMTYEQLQTVIDDLLL